MVQIAAASPFYICMRELSIVKRKPPTHPNSKTSSPASALESKPRPFNPYVHASQKIALNATYTGCDYNGLVS